MGGEERGRWGICMSFTSGSPNLDVKDYHSTDIISIQIALILSEACSYLNRSISKNKVVALRLRLRRDFIRGTNLGSLEVFNKHLLQHQAVLRIRYRIRGTNCRSVSRALCLGSLRCGAVVSLLKREIDLRRHAASSMQAKSLRLLGTSPKPASYSRS